MHDDDEDKFIRLEIPVDAFEVEGGASRSIAISSRHDIAVTSELEQTRAFQNIRLWIGKGKTFDARTVTELLEMATNEMTVNVMFGIERYSGGKMLEGLALIDREASVYRPLTFEKIVTVDFRIPSTKLYHGKIQGTTLRNQQEM